MEEEEGNARVEIELGILDGGLLMSDTLEIIGFSRGCQNPVGNFRQGFYEKQKKKFPSQLCQLFPTHL